MEVMLGRRQREAVLRRQQQRDPVVTDIQTGFSVGERFE
jgi:hypothetical protein